MYDFSHDKVLGSEVVRKFPREMVTRSVAVLSSLDDYEMRGMYGIKVTDNKFILAFSVATNYKVLFSYDDTKQLGLNLATKKDELILSMDNVDSNEKINLINEVIKENLNKDNLISSVEKRK